MPIYNKLVRDKIPKIIETSGKTCFIRTLSSMEYIEELKKKSKEELQEYLNAASDEEALAELADLLEVIVTLSEIHGSSYEKLEKIRQDKLFERGGFKERIYLQEVKDE